MFLDYYTAEVDNKFEYDSKDAWDSGEKYSIDTNSVPGSIVISNTDDVDNIFYGTDGKAIVVSSGYGDGEYPVYIKRTEDGIIKELTIKFF